MNYEIQNAGFIVDITSVDVTANVGESTRIDVGEAINYIKSGEAEIDAAVTRGTNSFNTNAANKTAAFNSNANDKTNDFNTNATNKTTDFNDNYTAKKALIDAEVQTAKDWATKTDGKVDGVDYSAKYYAQSILPYASDITTVAGIASDVTTVSGISSDIGAVSAISSDITTVAGDSASINAVAADLTNIDNASSYANLAKDWATKSSGKVDGDDYSAKYYAQNAQSASQLASMYANNAYLSANQASGSSSVAAAQANLAKRWAIGDPSEPTGNSAKYWAEQAATTLSDKQDKLTVGTGIDITSNVISVTSTVSNGAALGATAVQPSDLATVATTGAYSDLSGTPTIPTVNNATLTITQGGVSKGTFTANASSDVTIALDAGGGGSYTAGTNITIASDVISTTAAKVTFRDWSV